jgi:hypothetical protein
MGTGRDLRARLTSIRTYFWTKVEQARNAIYKTGFAITSDWVENILKEFSLVPTIVCSRSLKTAMSLTDYLT